MKSSLMLRLIAAFILLAAYAPAHADPLPTQTFQLPISRFTHTFTLWQRHAPMTSPELISIGGERVTYYIENPSGGDGAYFFELKAQFDPTAGEYWLEDTTPATPETSLPNTLGLTHALWRTASSTPQHYMAFPASRVGDTFSIEQAGGGTYTVTTGPPLQEAVMVGGVRQWQPYGYFEGWALFSPTGNQWFRVLDHTTGERTEWLPFTQSNLGSVHWTVSSTPPILHAVTIHLAPHQAGRDFVLYSSHGPAQTLRAVDAVHWDAAANAFVPDHAAMVNGTVGVGMYYWLVRVADGKSSLPPGVSSMPVGLDPLPAGIALMGNANQTQAWNSLFAQDGLPPAVNHWASFAFEISHARAGHDIRVHYLDGSSEPLWLAGTGGMLAAYDDNGAYSEFHYDIYGAPVDDNRDWWLVDHSAYSGSGEAFPMRARRIYDGWNPGHPAVPPGQLSFVMNSSRLGHTLRVYQAGDPLGWPVVRSTLPVYIAEVRSPAWPLSYDVSTFYAQALGNPGLPWTVRDLRTGEEISGIGGSNDLSTWRTTSSKILSISSSRRDHDLWLVQPDGSSSHLIQGAFQGDYSTTPAGVAWWNPYYKFLIRTHCKNLLDWRIEDRTTGDMTETSLQFAHQNRDMNRFLGYEWIALAPPKNLSWLVHYMSGATIRWEIGAGASIDGGFILERRIGSGAWEEIESSIPAARAASPAGTPYQTTDIAASLGSNFYYRVRYTYGGRRSGPSPSVQILWPSDSDLDGIPDAWELEHFGHLGQSNLTDFDRDGINDRLEYTGNTDPRDRFNGTGCTLTVVSGQSHQVHPNFTATYPFKLLVTDLKGVGVGNWRVTFKTPTGLIATSRTPPGGRWGKSCVVEPDADGHALIYLRGGSMPASHVVTASVGGLSRSATLVVSNDLPPAKPINVAVTSISSRTLSISWEDGSAGDADLFTVERSTDSINWTSKGKFGRGVTSMEDTPPTSGIYHYRIISSYDHE